MTWTITRFSSVIIAPDVSVYYVGSLASKVLRFLHKTFNNQQTLLKACLFPRARVFLPVDVHQTAGSGNQV